MIIKLQNGDKIKVESTERAEARKKFNEYSQLSTKQKLKRNLNIASNFLKSGPNITNFGNAISALFGDFNPENPDLHYGEPPNVGIKDFTKILKTARVIREFKDVLSKAPKTKEFIMPGLVGWAPKTKFKGYHASNENPFIPDFFREGWAQKTHNAVKGIYIANGKTPGYGFLTKRKYVHPVETTFEKPQIQLGEVKGRTKNSIRNQIERDAQEQGADGIIFKGIADNQMQNQFIAKTLNPDTKVVNKSKQNLNRYKREDVLIGNEWGAELYSYPEYIKYRISKLKQIAPDKIEDYTVPKLDPKEVNLKKAQLISRDNFIRNNIGFNPMAIMSMGKNLKTHLWEINRRLSKLYPNLPKYVTEDVNNAENTPFIIGYFNEPNIVGFHSQMRGINLVEPSPKSNLPRTMLHEGVMHGTDSYMTEKIANAYQQFINKIYESPYIENGIYVKNNWPHKAPKGTESWEEGRATFGEIRKFLYDKISKDNNIQFSPENMDKLIPIFEKTADKLNINDVVDLFNKTGGYGEVYGTIGPKANSNFLKDSKDLLKYMPATIPFLIPRKEEKK